MKKACIFLFFMCFCIPFLCAATDISYNLKDCGVVITLPFTDTTITRGDNVPEMLERLEQTQESAVKVLEEEEAFLWSSGEIATMMLYQSEAENDSLEMQFAIRRDAIYQDYADQGMKAEHVQRITIADTSYLTYEVIDGDARILFYDTIHNGLWLGFTFEPYEGVDTEELRNFAFLRMHQVRFYDENFEALQKLRDSERIFYDEQNKIGLIHPEEWTAIRGEGSRICAFWGTGKNHVLLERFPALDPIIDIKEITVENTAPLLRSAGIKALSDIEVDWLQQSDFYRIDAERERNGEMMRCRSYFFGVDGKMYGISYFGVRETEDYWDFVAMVGSLSRWNKPEQKPLQPLPAHRMRKIRKPWSGFDISFDELRMSEFFSKDSKKALSFYSVLFFFLIILPCGLQRLFSATARSFLRACGVVLIYDAFAVISMMFASGVYEGTTVRGILVLLLANVLGVALLSVHGGRKTKNEYRHKHMGKSSFEDDMIYGNPLWPWMHTIQYRKNPGNNDFDDKN